MAQFMKSLGADDALLFDGGGSTELVARRVTRSSASRTRRPTAPSARSRMASACSRRRRRQSARSRGLPAGFARLPRSAPHADREGSRRRGCAGRGRARWRTRRRRCGARAVGRERTLTCALAPARRPRHGVRVLGALDRLELGAKQLSFTDAVPSAATTLAVTGRDARATPLRSSSDMTLDYDHAVVGVERRPMAASPHPARRRCHDLVVRVGDETATVAISVGVVTTPVYAFNSDDGATRWVLNGTAPGQLATNTPDGLQISYNTARNMGAAPAAWSRAVALPGRPLRRRAPEDQPGDDARLDRLLQTPTTSPTRSGTPPTASGLADGAVHGPRTSRSRCA